MNPARDDVLFNVFEAFVRATVISLGTFVPSLVVVDITFVIAVLSDGDCE